MVQVSSDKAYLQKTQMRDFGQRYDDPGELAGEQHMAFQP